MNRYVLVCVIEDKAGKFHDRIVESVCHKFNKRRTKLPAHITLKAPFETDKIAEMESVLESFVTGRDKTPIKVEGFGKFRRDVIYIDVKVSEEAKKVHDELMDELVKIPWIELKENEGKNKVFHCTIVSKRIQDKFKEIWEYVNQFTCDFNLYFDNLTLYKWQDNTWVLYKKYKFRETK